MSSHPEYEYLRLVAEILKNGRTKKGRGIHPMKSIFGYQMRFDLRKGFPCFTTKKMSVLWLKHELLWFISGKNESIDYLEKKKVKLWDGFMEGHESLGPIYGVQWRRWPRYIPVSSDRSSVDSEHVSVENSKSQIINSKQIQNSKFETNAKKSQGINVLCALDSPSNDEVKVHRYAHPEEGSIGMYRVEYVDQLARAINEIKNNPDSKAIIVSAWNAGQLEDMRLPPCHTFFQFDVRKGKLRMQLYQRSGDVFLGIPTNTFEYAMLLKMVAQVTGLEAREFIHTIGDAHLYHNQIDAAKELLRRKPYPFPELWLNPEVMDIDAFTSKDIKLKNYKHHPRLKVPVVIV